MEFTDDSPIASLAAAIEEAAFRCAEPLQDQMAFPSDAEQEEKWLQIVWEHIFLLMHLVNRNAYGTLDEIAHKRLIEETAPRVVMPLLLELSEGRPGDFRERMAKVAYEGLNASEREYAECGSFLEKPEFTGSSLVSVFARKVSGLAGRSMDPELMAEIIGRTVETYKGLKLRDRIGAIAGFLESGKAVPPAP